MIISKEDWTPINGIEYGEDSPELEVIYTEKNALVSAGPGAGKTELLAQKAAFLLQTNTSPSPRKILALSFKVDAAENIKERVDKRCGEVSKNRLVSMTYDKFFKIIFDSYIHLLPHEFKVQADYEIQETSFLRNYFTRMYDNGHKFGLNASEYKFVKKDIKSYLENHYLFDTTLPFPNVEQYDEARLFWNDVLKGNEHEKPKLHFKMITRLAELIVNTVPSLKESLRITYSHVFLDEFQDTNIPQYSAIKSIFADSSVKITAVGDEKQRIMLWAGAMKDVFSKFIEDFEADKIVMYCNHRSAPKLLAVQKKFIKELTDNDLSIEPSRKWNENQGEYGLKRFKNAEDEAEWILEYLQKSFNEKDIKQNDVCILTRCRVQDYSSILIDKLIDNGLKARVEDEYQSLLREPLIKILLLFTNYSLRRKAPELWREISSLVIGLHGRISSSNTQLNLNQESSIVKDVNNHCDSLRNCSSLEQLRVALNSIVLYLTPQKIISKYPQYRTERRISELIERYSELLWKEYENCQDWKTAIDGFVGLNSIPVMSIHKSKGLEFKIVILQALEGSSFFGFKDNYYEELSNVFVAFSRAEETFIATISDQRQIIGRLTYSEEYKIPKAIELLENDDFHE